MSRARAHGLRAVVTLLAGATATAVGLPCEREPQGSLATVPPALTSASDGLADASALRQRAWADTYAVLARLADAGSADAARMALEMHHHGRSIYGMRFEASEQQQRRWQIRIACSTPPCAAVG